MFNKVLTIMFANRLKNNVYPLFTYDFEIEIRKKLVYKKKNLFVLVIEQLCCSKKRI